MTLKMLLLGEDRTASRALKGAGRTADETAGKFSHWGAVAGIAAAAAGVALVKFGRDSIKAYSDAQEGQKRLEDAFARFPALADTNQKALQKLNTTLQKKTKYDDDNIASGQAVLAQFKVTGTQLTEITPLLLDYASRTGKDIPAAAQDVGKALLGNAKALKNIGIKYTATGDTAKDFTNITALLRTQVGGFATREGQTAAGQAAILKNQFGEVEETVGSQLVPALMKLLSGLLAVIRVVQNYATYIVPLIAGIGLLTGGIYALIVAQRISTFLTKQQTEETILYTVWTKVAAAASKIWAAAQWLLNAALTANPIGLVVVAIALLVAGIIIAYKHSATFRAIVQGAFNGVKVAGQAMWVVLKAAFRGIVAAGQWMWKVLKPIFEALAAAFDAARAAASFVSNLAGSGGPSLHSLPQSPANRAGLRGHAAGGIFTRPTFGLIGEAGPEAVVPLSAGRGQGGFGGGTTNNFYINGALDPVGVGKQIESVMQKLNQRTGRPAQFSTL